jgi:hypothetical protein
MGRLAGFSYREITRKMRQLGFEFYRSGKGTPCIFTETFSKMAGVGKAAICCNIDDRAFPLFE